MAVLTTQERVRRSLLRSAQVQDRSELDSGVNRDAFWTALVEIEFNDANNKPSLDLSLVLEDRSIDASIPPLCHRSGSGAQIVERALRRVREPMIVASDPLQHARSRCIKAKGFLIELSNSAIQMTAYKCVGRIELSNLYREICI
eukprot:IDg891t1